jgi:hypothetical protein
VEILSQAVMVLVPDFTAEQDERTELEVDIVAQAVMVLVPDFTTEQDEGNKLEVDIVAQAVMVLVPDFTAEQDVILEVVVSLLVVDCAARTPSSGATRYRRSILERNATLLWDLADDKALSSVKYRSSVQRSAWRIYQRGG